MTKRSAALPTVPPMITPLLEERAAPVEAAVLVLSEKQNDQRLSTTSKSIESSKGSHLRFRSR